MLTSSLRRPRGWRAAVLLLLAGACAPALAAPPTCGTWQDESGSTRLVIESPNQGYRQTDGFGAQPYLLDRKGDTLQVADLDDGYIRSLGISEGGRVLADTLAEYRQVASARCRPAATFAAGTCGADIGTCLAGLSTVGDARLLQWCGEGVPAACKQLLEHYRTAAVAAEPAPEDPALAEPAVCRQDSGQYDAQACRAAAREVMGKAMASLILGAMRRDDAPLPAAQLDQVLQLCQRQTAGSFCADVATVQWDNGRYLQARDALQLACRTGQDRDTCAKAEVLAGIPAAELRTVPATGLPCGSYLGGRGLMDHLAFGDGGMLSAGFGGTLRARLENGEIRIRHDQGDDFVFRTLANGNLIGIDRWNRYGYYVRQPGVGAQHCSAPVVFVEVPLPQDCPAVAEPGGAQACCAAGKLQGCNAAGHQLGLRERWDEAAPFYQRLCAAGVREGCENLATVYQHTGDDALPEAMAALCAKDGKGTHVACDVHATRNWPLLAAGAVFARMATEADAGAAAAADASEEDGTTDDAPAPAPAATPSNRKGR